VSKLRENAKTVIGVGVKRSTSDLFRSNCDDFIYYDDLVREELAKKRAEIAAQPAAAPIPASQIPSSKSASAQKPAAAQPSKQPEKKPKSLSVEKAMGELLSTLELLRTEKGADQIFHAGGIKSTIKRRNPGFDERAHGFKSFSELLHEAQKRSLIKLDPNEQGGLRILPDE
jgi:hypothetical protein